MLSNLCVVRHQLESATRPLHTQSIKDIRGAPAIDTDSFVVIGWPHQRPGLNLIAENAFTVIAHYRRHVRHLED